VPEMNTSNHDPARCQINLICASSPIVAAIITAVHIPAGCLVRIDVVPANRIPPVLHGTGAGCGTAARYARRRTRDREAAPDAAAGKARRAGSPPSPGTPACVAVAGSAGPPPPARWTPAPSCWPLLPWFRGSVPGAHPQSHRLHRHQDTGYDALLMSGVDRTGARDRVQNQIGQVLTAWRTART
jgi:hypothetical protein